MQPLLSDALAGCLTTSSLRMSAMRQGLEAKQRYGGDGLNHARRLIAQVSRRVVTVASSPILMLPVLRGTAFHPKSGPGTRRSADMRIRPMAGIGLATSREPVVWSCVVMMQRAHGLTRSKVTPAISIVAQSSSVHAVSVS